MPPVGGLVEDVICNISGEVERVGILFMSQIKRASVQAV